MDRGRGGRARATKKRGTATLSFHTTAHSQHQNHHSLGQPDSLSPTTPVSSANLQRAPSTAPQRGGRSRLSFTTNRTTSPSGADPASRVTPRTERPARSATFTSGFTFESPSAAGIPMTADPVSLRKRAKTFEPNYDGNGTADDDLAHSKGGHSLRKRTRVDYTQEQIDDDLVSSTARAELAAKSAITPSSRTRKRKGLHDDFAVDFEGGASSIKRRRADKSPAPARGSSRRRSTARKPLTEINSYIDQPSDNEVQDTILVGVSMDEIQESDEASDQSFDDEAESRPSSSDGSDAAQAQTQPTAPQPHAVSQLDRAISFQPEIQESAGPQLLPPHQPNDKAEDSAQDILLGPPQSQHTKSEEVESAPLSHITTQQPDLIAQQSQGSEKPPREPKITEPASQTTEMQAVDPQPELEAQPAEPDSKTAESISGLQAKVPPSAHNIQEADETVKQPEVNGNQYELELKIEIQTSQLPEVAELKSNTTERGHIDSLASEPDKIEEVKPSFPVDKVPVVSHPVVDALDASALAPEPAVLVTPVSTPSRSSMRTRKHTYPKRLSQVEIVYAAETPFGSRLNLTPYEAEDVVHPGAYSEWVSKDKAEFTALTTPTPTPAAAEPETAEFTWDGRRPLRVGEFKILYRQEVKNRDNRGEPRISMVEFNNECVRLFRLMQQQEEAGGGSRLAAKSKAKLEPSKHIHPKRPVSAPTTSFTASFDETPRSSQAPESQVPSAAASPAPDDDFNPGLAEAGEDDPEIEEPIEGPGEADIGGTGQVMQKPHHQYSFPKLRDASEFVQALEGPQDMDTASIYENSAATVEALHAWQQEYIELKKFLDDEENAKRRQANDKTIVNWENRQKADEPPPHRRHFDEIVKGPPVFEVRGARAPKPYVDDPVLEQAREQDKIMGQAYGFKHNAHPTLIGRQNPEEQRWEMTERGLRDRKKTEKAAELAEENVIEGKRARKPRNFSDQSKDPSRSGTPNGNLNTSLVTGKRPYRRKIVSTTAPVDETEVQDHAQPTEVAIEPVVRKRRGPKPRALIAAEAAAAAAAQEAADVDQGDKTNTDDEGHEHKPRSARKRPRGVTSLNPPPPAPLLSTSTETEEAKAIPQRAIKGRPGLEIPSASFYGNPSPVNTQPESRPSTASSEATVNTAETTESAYSLRDKRKRNFVLENDPELEPRAQKRARAAVLPKLEHMEPKKRGPRRKAATSQPLLAPPMANSMAPPQPLGGLKAPAMFFNNGPPALAPAPGPFMHTFNAAPAFQPGGLPPPPPAPPAIKKPITRIKLTNNGSTSQPPSRASTPASNGPSSTPKGSAKAARGGPRTSVPAEAVPPVPSLLSTSLNDLADKPYAEMTKSEKMSWSMRRRWASGEMQGAVEKRRTTLAIKKAEKAAGTPNGADMNVQTLDPSSAGASAPNTPSLHPTLPGPLAFPQLPHNLQPLQPPQLLLQKQPMPYPYFPPHGPVA
ncbi:hypothetical protein B0T17DRAFT_218053 [Bombardia bombarda]|uniref:Uncharacterized protein n=1 Tax=Bombardia bombarda TaxID=252184 RepID=A0AA39XAV7_9PEZI|nr:hypothetical protein B0T17DRAFT_218053 [Bombardia bombarda]